MDLGQDIPLTVDAHITVLCQVFAFYGLPEEVVSYQGPQLSSQAVAAAEQVAVRQCFSRCCLSLSIVR